MIEITDTERKLLKCINGLDHQVKTLRESAVAGWQTALSLAVAYGAQASESAARTVLASLGSSKTEGEPHALSCPDDTTSDDRSVSLLVSSASDPHRKMSIMCASAVIGPPTWHVVLQLWRTADVVSIDEAIAFRDDLDSAIARARAGAHMLSILPLDERVFAYLHRVVYAMPYHIARDIDVAEVDVRDSLDKLVLAGRARRDRHGCFSAIREGDDRSQVSA